MNMTLRSRLQYERPIPPQDRVRCDDAGYAREPTAAEDLAFHGQAAALIVREAEPSGSERRAKNPVLLEQVVNHCLLLPVDRAGEEENDEGERRRQRVHGVSVPERLTRCKARQIRDRAPLGWSRVPGPQASCDCVEFADYRGIRSRASFRTGWDSRTVHANEGATRSMRF